MNRVSINKVTVYRILDLLVDKGVITRLCAGDRAFRYGMGDSRNHPDHAQFVCTRCGAMGCMEPGAAPEVMGSSHVSGEHVIKRVDVRFEGICGGRMQAERR